MTRPPKIQGPQEWLYVTVVGALSLYLVVGVVAWSWMILAGIEAPTAFTTVLTAVVGALAGIVSPLQAPSPRTREAAAE